MRKLLLLSLIYLGVLSFSSAQVTITDVPQEYDKLSPATHQLLGDAQQLLSINDPSAKELTAHYAIQEQKDGQLKIGALAMVDLASIDEAALAELGVSVRTRAGKIWSLDIPLTSLKSLHKVGGLEYVDADRYVRPRLEESRRVSRVDEVHNALEGLTQAYTGQGVVVGILDFGFVVNHPAFYTEDGTSSRVARVWNQTGEGTAPAPFGYGAEFIGSDIPSLGYSTSQGSHGTHVGGIAAASGHGSEGKHRGFAPAAEVVMVELGSSWETFNFTNPFSGATATPSQLLDGAQYILNYAASQNKPAVINMSLGTHIGPHDGTSLLEIGLDELAGPGKIMVGAAGNEGETPLHVSHTFSGDQILATHMTMPSGEEAFLSGAGIFWGEPNSSFEINVGFYQVSDGSLVQETGFVSTSNNQTGRINDADDWNAGTATTFAFVETRNAYVNNNRPYAYISLSMDAPFFNDYYAIVQVRNATGTVHGWNNGNGQGNPFLIEASEKVSLSGNVVWKAGDTQFTVGEFGTAKEVITVGASNITSGTDESFGYFNGGIAGFSSRGPTLDGRVKPDIVAPGNRIISAYNREEQPDPSDIVTTVNGNDGNEYIFAFSQGTSMAAPAVAGAIALLLQANPQLDHAAILEVFRKTSTSTGEHISLETVDANGHPKSNTWGYGQMNVLAAIQDVLATGNPPAPLAAEISANPTTAVVGSTVNFSSSVTGGTSPYTYAWSFTGEGSATTPTQASTSITFLAPGTSTVSLQVTDQTGATAASDIPITVEAIPALVVDFSASPTTVTEGESVSFTSQVSGGVTPYNYQWSFTGEGNPSSLTTADISIVFAEPGTSSISLAVTDSRGQTVTETKDNFITIEEELIAGLANTALANAIQLYPNPSQSGQTVKIISDNGDILRGIKSARLISVSGQQTVLDITKTSNDLNIQLPSVSAGNYFILFETESGQAAKQIKID